MSPVKILFSPEAYPHGYPPILENITQDNVYSWTPLLQHKCSFPTEIFSQVMLNLIRNPNINSNYLFRADISLEQLLDESFQNDTTIPARIIQFRNYTLQKVMVRTMIPRNTLKDRPLDQTCLFYQHTTDTDTGNIQSLVIYLPHISSPDESPFYHPKVYGIAFQHTFNPETQDGMIAIHYAFFDSEPRTQKLERTAEHLLAALYKHGQGTAAGYVKKVHHDTIIPQAIVQNTYARLKVKYAKTLIENWAESTNPEKHVFEDLNIAAFLIELWADTYKDTEFPGYVDIGCGNGLLVHILSEEGYKGWGFDARERKSWSVFGSKTRDKLEELVLIPSILYSEPNENQTSGPDIHDGTFPKGTFIISNHADELTPWTPILANISQSPFMMIPCCSHALSGARCRAPPPKGSEGTPSAYASLVAWVAGLAEGCGWEVEKEWLRIPSTRNAALIGRRRKLDYEEIDVGDFVVAHGGAAGWKDNAMKLVTGKAKNH
ncbi:methyltransferase-like protein [Sclerotinia borealis F-4128]|uniref:tRNA (uracil-O(2)-)-methyltransferase n=1 Tax=Sclerotinia borealis (strain F-4128) TaxID=1432307 RepID=W9C9R5_SCLBF|nr:methyltransferase-like protein [Sclerotinia borealis F-4128]